MQCSMPRKPKGRRLLRRREVVAFAEPAGSLLGKTRTRDVVDASVAALSIRYEECCSYDQSQTSSLQWNVSFLRPRTKGAPFEAVEPALRTSTKALIALAAFRGARLPLMQVAALRSRQRFVALLIGHNERVALCPQRCDGHVPTQWNVRDLHYLCIKRGSQVKAESLTFWADRGSCQESGITLKAHITSFSSLAFRVWCSRRHQLFRRRYGNAHRRIRAPQTAVRVVEVPTVLTNTELDLYRCHLEEWRASLFAQELRTAEPVSAKKIAALWAKVVAKNVR